MVQPGRMPRWVTKPASAMFRQTSFAVPMHPNAAGEQATARLNLALRSRG
jgi:hypothetical protein